MTDLTPEHHFDPTDPIVAAWAAQDETGDSSMLSTNPAELTKSVAKAHRKDQRRLFWLNMRESVPCLLIAIFFAGGASDGERPWAIFVASALILGVGVFLAANSWQHHRADKRWGTSVRDQLERRIAQVEHRATMYRTVGRWYFLPFVAAFGLLYYGSGGSWDRTSGVVFWGLVGLVTAIAYPLNRWIGRTKYETEVERLSTLLEEFDR